MGLFSDKIAELKKTDKPLYKTPRSVQQTIEIKKVYENGIFEVAHNRYSKTYRFADVNYSTISEAEQEDFFLKYCKLLNSMDTAFKITIFNNRRDMDKVERDILQEPKKDGFDMYREANNELIRSGITKGRRGIEQERYLTVIIERRNLEDAKAQFATIEAGLKKAFAEMGSQISELDGNERLKVLYDYYHLNSGENMEFDISSYDRDGGDFKNDLSNSMLKYSADHISDENKYARALFIRKFPTSLSDGFLTEIAAVPVHSLISIDVVPVPKELTMQLLEKKQRGIESDIIRQQKVRNKNNEFMSDISYSKRREKQEIEDTIDEVLENDASMFFVGVTIIIAADSMEELNDKCDTINIICRGAGCTIDTHYYKQREALNSALPIGVRQTNTMRSMLTQSLAAFLPFNVQELYDSSGGIWYGINQVSKGINIADRKKLPNGNGFLFGVPGVGKSLFAKMEMEQVFINTKDDIIVIDPMNEYFHIAENFGGAVINLSSYSENYVNPLALDVSGLSPEERKKRIDRKCEFVLSLCEQCMGTTPIAREKSIIGRCVKDMYMDIMASKEPYIPVMTDLYQRLLEQPERIAKDIALDLELFVTGSLDIFNHQSNISAGNRFVVYGTRDLGKDLSPLASLIMMEAIQDRVLENFKKGKATWIYIDEFHTLLNYAYTATYLNQFWKELRKLGGLCTGITQNVTDILKNDAALSILSNSEFIVLLKQSLDDGALLSRTVGVSPAELRYVTNSPVGTGLLKFGEAVIPFDITLPKNSVFYDLFNTNMHEKVLTASVGTDGR